MLNIHDKLISETAAKIKPNALATLLAIAIHLNLKTGRAFPSNKRLQKLTGLGRDALAAALVVLKENSLLESYQTPGAGGRFGQRQFRITTKFISIFVTVDEAEPLPENPYTVEPETVEPETVEPETENPAGELINEKGNQLKKKEQIKEKEPLAENEFPQAIEGGLIVTVIEGHSEVLPPVAKKKKKAAPGAGDGVIQAMVTAFETEHRQHFKDAGGEWIGFTWQSKEFPALNSIRKELEKRYFERMKVEPTAENIVESWSLFLRKAAKCDKFILDNLFTPSKIWGQFQSIIQKIHTNNGRPPSTTSNGRPDQNERNRLAVEKMVQDVQEGRL